jgi:hypothetical protein
MIEERKNKKKTRPKKVRRGQETTNVAIWEKKQRQ